MVAAWGPDVAGLEEMLLVSRFMELSGNDTGELGEGESITDLI